MPKPVRREFLQLANTYDPDKHRIAGHYISEKCDGARCFWDGGVTRGLPTMNVPWASVNDPKNGKPKSKVKSEATGLWSRYGNPIMAPDWFLNQLPCCPLDGELWAGRGRFQVCMSVTRKDVPVDEDWRQIKYAVYSSPPIGCLFASGEIKNANMHVAIDEESVTKWLLSHRNRVPDMRFSATKSCSFAEELAFLNAAIESENDHVFLHRQIRLSDDEAEARELLERYLAGILDQGGEGVMIRDPSACWTPKRHSGILKYKPFLDDEAKVIGFVAGEGGKTGNLLGHIGALIVEWNGVEFRLGTGMTFEKRRLTDVAHKWAAAHPGEECRDQTSGNHRFHLGKRISFKYRELTDDGIPKEARFWRIRDEE
jgi:DNA ligase-1